MATMGKVGSGWASKQREQKLGAVKALVCFLWFLEECRAEVN